MSLYLYDGPVTQFGEVIARDWKASTRAVSQKKARCNLIYQYKKQHNLSADSRVELLGEIRSKERGNHYG